MRIVTAGTPEWDALLAHMQSRRDETALEVTRTVSDIIYNVKTNGWEAVCRYSERLDHAQPREILKDEWDTAVTQCPAAVIQALNKAAKRIEAYQAQLLAPSGQWLTCDGGQVGVQVRGLHRAGIYVPGGRAAYPSSVLMNAVPAKVAGVGEIIMVTPPTEHLSPAVLAAARIAGVDRVFAVGGAQAVAALAYGAGPVPKADKVVGPGNVYVTEAKRQLFGVIDIDMIAGPSEVLVLCDETAHPVHVAADLLSQAEHDPLAGAWLMTTSPTLLRQAEAEIERQKALLPRREIIDASLRDYGALVLCENLKQAADAANQVAPEHLEIVTKDPEALLPLIVNAGAVFMGPWSPEPLGDYMAGPSHVLPTGATARFFSPLSVDDFVKKTSVIAYSRDALESVWRDVAALAEEEGLHAHANAMKVRFCE